MTSLRRLLCGIACLLTVIVAGLGNGVRAQTNPPAPSVTVRHVTSLMARVVTGDFNGDGIVDVASASPIAGPSFPMLIAVSLGNGNGTFATPKSTGARGSVVAVGDFNKDGKLDLVVATTDESDLRPLRLLPGNGDGTFGPSLPIGEGSATEVQFGVAADVDGDGNLDVAVGMLGEADDDSMIIWRGHGDGTFPEKVVLPMSGTASGPQGAAVADLNGDGRLDIAVANHNGRFVSVFLNQGGLHFTASDIPLGEQANDVAAADINHDGKMDLVVATSMDASDDLYYTGGSVKVLRGNGNGTFQAPVNFDTAPGAWRVVVGDFNRDGVTDIATANRSGKISVDFCGHIWDTVSILPGRSDGTFGAVSSFFLGNPATPSDSSFFK